MELLILMAKVFQFRLALILIIQGDPKKNRTPKNFMKSYRDLIDFKHFAGSKLQSVYNHTPKFQSLKSLRIKVMFFPKYAPNGFHGIEGKLPYVVQNVQLLEYIFLWVFH